MTLLHKDNEGYIWEISSQTDPTVKYDVAYDVHDGWFCDCPHAHFRKVFCKHMKTAAHEVGIDDTQVFKG